MALDSQCRCTMDTAEEVFQSVSETQRLIVLGFTQSWGC